MYQHTSSENKSAGLLFTDSSGRTAIVGSSARTRAYVRRGDETGLGSGDETELEGGGATGLGGGGETGLVDGIDGVGRELDLDETEGMSLRGGGLGVADVVVWVVGLGLYTGLGTGLGLAGMVEGGIMEG